MATWEYELPADELVGRLMRAAAHSGLSNSGLVIDPCGPGYASDARYLAGVVAARIESKIPPFRPGEKVRATKRVVNLQGYPLIPLHGESAGILTVKRVHYNMRGWWFLSFVEVEEADRGEPLYEAESFEKAVAPVVVAETSGSPQ